jgi:hypothetical protein
MSTVKGKDARRAYLVNDLEPLVGLADIQTTLVGFPTEPHPGVDDRSFNSILVFSGSIFLDQRVNQQGIRLQRQFQVILDIVLLGVGC